MCRKFKSNCMATGILRTIRPSSAALAASTDVRDDHRPSKGQYQRCASTFRRRPIRKVSQTLRLMKLAEKFNFPIVTLIDTPGAHPYRSRGARRESDRAEHVRDGVPQSSRRLRGHRRGASGGAASASAWRVFMMEYLVFRDLRILFCPFSGAAGIARAGCRVPQADCRSHV